jgi:hypothetical protein
MLQHCSSRSRFYSKYQAGYGYCPSSIQGLHLGFHKALSCVVFQEEFLTTLNVQDMGFDSVEAFLLVLHDSVLHLRYVNKKILVYPFANEAEPEKDDPLPHITEVRTCCRV